MKKFRAVLICTGIVLSFYAAVSQTIPLGTLPMQYNGGFAGESESTRVVAGTGIMSYAFYGMTSKRSVGYNYYASYDKFFSKLRSGIGVTFNRSHHNYYYQVDNSFHDRRNTFLIVSYSPKFSFKGKYTLAPFIDFDYSANENERVDSDLQTSTGVRTGFLFNTKKFYAGFSFHYAFNDKAREIYPSVYAQGNALTVQAGYTFQKLPESKFAFTPQMAFMIVRRGSTFDTRDFFIDLNLMFRFKKFIWSINNNGLGLGYQNDKFRIMLSQSYVFFSQGNWQGSLSLRYVLPKSK